MAPSPAFPDLFAQKAKVKPCICTNIQFDSINLARSISVFRYLYCKPPNRFVIEVFVEVKQTPDPDFQFFVEDLVKKNFFSLAVFTEAKDIELYTLSLSLHSLLTFDRFERVYSPKSLEYSRYNFSFSRRNFIPKSPIHVVLFELLPTDPAHNVFFAIVFQLWIEMYV